MCRSLAQGGRRCPGRRRSGALNTAHRPVQLSAGELSAGELSGAERRAVSGYTGGEFLSINAFVENGYRVPAYAADDPEFVRYMTDTVAGLEHAVSRSVLGTPVSATRAIPGYVAERVYGPVGSSVGATVTEHRFVSTTTNPTPPNFGDVTITYRLAPGVKALDINSTGVPCKRDENELLLGPHQSFRVVSDQMVGSRRVICVESQSSETRPRSGGGRDRSLAAGQRD